MSWEPVTIAWRVHRLRIEERPPISRIALNELNKQSRTPERGGPPPWGLGDVLTNPPCKKIFKKYSHAGCLIWRQNNTEVNGLDWVGPG